MKGIIKQVLQQPPKFNKDGEETAPKLAAININVEITNEKQKAAVHRLTDLLTGEEVHIEVTPLQGRLDLDEQRDVNMEGGDVTIPGSADGTQETGV